MSNMREALAGLLKSYTSLANCGDCGHWDCEKEAEVIAARQALAAHDAASEVTAAQREAMSRFVEGIYQWSEAYPLDVFPKPDLEKARVVLKASGMTLDSISADAMRHVITTIRKDLDAIGALATGTP